MKDLDLNKFIIYSALISISWFWYHRMVYVYNFLPRQNTASNLHEINTRRSDGNKFTIKKREKKL